MKGCRLAFFNSIGPKRPMTDVRLIELRHVGPHPFRENLAIFQDDDRKYTFTANRGHLEWLFLCEIDTVLDWGGQLDKTMVEVHKQ